MSPAKAGIIPLVLLHIHIEEIYIDNKTNI